MDKKIQIGDRFGNLVVEKEIEPFVYKSGIKDRQYLCRCACGKEKALKRNYLLSGYPTNCGCSRKNISFHIGDKYGQLTIIERAENDNRNQTRVVCKCDCGKVVTVRIIHLKSGMTKSCGCYLRERVKQSSTKHGQSNSRLYSVWNGMKDRCYNINNRQYKNYGGRGIKICEEWQDFEPFYKWAISYGYNPEAVKGKCTIDRINNDGNYEPSNCRWVGMDIQQKNKRPTSKGMFEMDGVVKSLKDWCKLYGTSPSVVYGRTQRGWDKVKAITTPIAERYRRTRR